MTLPLLAAAAACAAAAIYADRGGIRRPAFYALKPITTLLIIAAAAIQPGADPVYRGWVLAGLGLSLLGDVALMFHGSRWFLAGLGSFLVAHLLFIAAFSAGLDGVSLPWWIVASPLAGAALLPRLWPGAGSLRPAVVIYGLVLCAMVLAAAARHEAQPGTGALLGLVGAALFQVSDSVLGFRRFVRPFPGAQGLTLSTYWLAIALIALSS